MENLKEFKKKHCIDNKANLEPIKNAIQCIYEANQIVDEFISHIGNITEDESFVFRTNLNIIGRIFEQAEAMLVCIASNCYTSSEVLGRVVIEGSINSMYLSEIGNEKTIASFFKLWIDGHRKKLNEWKRKTQGKQYEKHVVELIDKRLELIDGHYNNFISAVIDKFNVSAIECKTLWPGNLLDRFEALKKETSYFSNYHRLSGSSHLTAEDTISWLISLDFSPEQRKALAYEACSYSIMMSRISSAFFIDAVAYFCIRHGMQIGVTLNRLKALSERLSISVEEISKQAGVPQIEL